MATRSRVRRSIDKRVFRKTASRTRRENIPGLINYRGGGRL